MATKLHQILAVERDLRRSSDRRITDGYQALQKPALLQGIMRVYRAKEDDSPDVLPPESTKLQVRASDVLKASQAEFEQLWDLVATKDWANCDAKADVVLPDGTMLIEQAPATYLLWLEHQLADIHTIVSKLPMLDPSEDWKRSDEQDCYIAGPIEQQRSKKVPRVLTKAPATDKHQADTEVWHEDVIVGFWSTTRFSGALPAKQVHDMLDRVNIVRAAVKTARSTANEVEIEQRKVSASTLAYIFG